MGSVVRSTLLVIGIGTKNCSIARYSNAYWRMQLSYEAKLGPVGNETHDVEGCVCSAESPEAFEPLEARAHLAVLWCDVILAVDWTPRGRRVGDDAGFRLQCISRVGCSAPVAC